MNLYDASGNTIEVGSSVSTADVKRAYMEAIGDGSINVGATVGATLSVSNLPTGWETNAQTAYNNLLTAYKSAKKRPIPFFITTDQHGAGLQPHRWVNNTDTYMDMANINLGDTVADKYQQTVVDGFRTDTKQVKNFIGVTGNHDALYYDTVLQATLNRSFNTTNLLRENADGIGSNYTVLDGNHGVRYVVMDEYKLASDGKSMTKMWGTELTKWFIDVLMNTEEDMIILKHWFFKRANGGKYQSREGVEQDTSISGESQLDFLTTIISARRSKASCTVTDTDGVSHTADFSGCSSDLLCCLHGHEHNEMYGYCGNLLCYVADWYGGSNNSSVFGMVDRDTNKLRIWEFDKTSCSDELTLSI